MSKTRDENSASIPDESAKTEPRLVVCRELPKFNPEELESVRSAFYETAPCRLEQRWLSTPQEEFTPGNVFVGCRNGNFCAFAELIDADIFTFARESQQRLWMLGDTFEIFLRAMDQEAYFEFHVAPNNLTLQMRFPGAYAAERVGRSQCFDEIIIQREGFSSKTWVKPENHRWFVFAQIAGGLIGQNADLSGSRWAFSFCRYDYTRGQNVPVISSTSAHTRPDFHRQHEWGVIRFE